MPRLRIAIVVPFLDEERFLGDFLSSLEAQTRPPDRLLLVDDGSTDGSERVAHEFAAAHAWAATRRRPPHAVGVDRLAGGAAVRAFAWGVAELVEPWDVVAKLDADLRLPADLLATLERAFLSDPRLGLAGSHLTVLDEDGTAAPHRCRPEHVEGATKFYRRTCFDEIAPLPLMLGWDTIDEVRARLLGWRTQSFDVPGGNAVQLREMGGHDGRLPGFRRWGACAWACGEHPLHVLAVCAQRVADPPPVLGSLHYAYGYARAAWRRLPRAEPEVRTEIRRDGLHRLGRRLSGRGRSARVPSRAGARA